MTQIQSEATQESKVTNEKPAEMLWCVKHEQMTKAETGVCGLGHVTTENGDLDFCCYPLGYTFTPPETDLPDDWAEQPAFLSDDERAAAEVEEMGMWLGGME